MFGQNVFTFLVGPGKQEYLVPCDVVSRASPVLERMMNGPMQESQQKIGALPEVEPSTFENFLSYACFNFNAMGSQQTGDTLNANFSKGKLIEVLLGRNHKTFTCKACCEHPKLKYSTSFSLCQSCQGENKMGCSMQCIVSTCLKDASHLDGLVCRDCLRSWSVFDNRGAIKNNFIEKMKLHTLHSLSELTSFRFDIPQLASEITQKVQKSIRGPHLPCTDLLSIGRLAVFAHIYDVSMLSEATCLGLYRELAFQNFDEKGVENILELAQMIYSNVADVAEGGHATSHTSRRLVSECIASRLENFVVEPHFKALLEQRRELIGDVLGAIFKERSK